MTPGSSGDEALFEGVQRVKRERFEARRHYDSISRFYDALEGAFEKRYRKLGLEVLDIIEGDKVLEIGFGTGEALMDIHGYAGEKGETVGIDFSTGMAAVAKEKLVDEGIVEEVSLICGDVIKAPFKADHFDKIFMSFTLELFDTPEISGVLGEIRRMMKDGGRLGVVSLSKEEDIFVKGYEVFHEIFPTLLDCRPIPVEDILKKEGFKIDSSMSERIGMIPLKIASAYQL